jgi:hypothetical protein
MIDAKTNSYIGACSDAKLLTVLEQIHADKEYRQPSRGICGAVRDCFFEDGKILDGHDEAILQQLMSYWPKHSGNLSYPVPSDDPGLNAKARFHSCSSRWSNNRWSKTIKYGQLRWELLEFCIQRLKDRIYEDKVS